MNTSSTSAFTSDFALQALQDSARAVTQAEGGLKRVRALRFNEPGISPDVWRQVCDMGWLSLLVPESRGGSELGMQALGSLMAELGRGLAPEPIAQAAIAASLLAGQQLEDHVAGKSLVLLALQEGHDDLGAAPSVRFANGRASGRKSHIPMAAAASAFLVTTDGGLVLVERNAAGVSLETLRTQDGGHFGVLTMVDAPAVLVGDDDGSAFDRAALALSAFLLGALEESLDRTVEFLKVREQFRKPIGSFQALQHKAADMKIQAVVARASIEGAAVSYDAPGPHAVRKAAVSRAKARAADASLFIAKESIQLHGAIGYTDEFDIGLYVRKALTMANLYGSASAHRRRYAALVPDDDING